MSKKAGDFTISVVGLGRLGLPLAVALKSKGFDVIGVDNDASKIAAINRGEAPFLETDLQHFLQQCKLQATDNLEQAASISDAIFVIVNTPSDYGVKGGGSEFFDVSNVLDVCSRIGAGISSHPIPFYQTIIIASTVNPGDCENLILPVLEAESGAKAIADFGLCHVPEFVALGDVIAGFMQPDFVIIGEQGKRTGNIVEEIYAIFTASTSPPIIRMSLAEAEIAKIALNTFLTTKISFANQIAGLCQNFEGADVDRVLGAIARDQRVSAKYFAGGGSYGGPCFPRDDRALMAALEQAEAPGSFQYHIARFNAVWHEYWMQKVLRAPQARNENAILGILGVSFKYGTDCLTDAIGYDTIISLRKQKRRFFCYDPVINLRESMSSAQKVADVSDVVFITQRAREFASLTFKNDALVIDLWRHYKNFEFWQRGLQYIAAGRGHDRLQRKL